MSKYPINKEYFPYNRLKPPSSRFVIKLAQSFMRVPRFFKKDKELNIEKITIDGYKNEKFDLYVLGKKDLKDNAPALIFFHGGGFIFDASKSHYQLAVLYAKRCSCKVIYVKYNLSPKYHFPYPQQEAYLATKYVFEHTRELNINVNKIGITGDSAGATLALSSIIIAREEHNEIYKPLFSVLIYPWLDNRGTSESSKKYTDSPMWSSKLSSKVGKYNNPDKIDFPKRYNSIVEVNDLSYMPKAYIEVAEFDPLHDDGILYYQLLKKLNIEAVLYETKGTMHGYDTKFNASTTQKMINQRIEYINSSFNKDN